MVICKLCGKELKNKRGLIVHLARIHNIHGPRGRLSLNTIYQYFPLLLRRHWSKAEQYLIKLVGKIGDDQWRKGYVHALDGMLVAFKSDRQSIQPYILKLEYCDKKQLQADATQLAKRLKMQLNREFDQGFFKAWLDYVHYKLYKV